MPEAVVAHGLGVRIGARSVLEDISLRVPYGSIFALLGPNGAGKTTLLKALMGFIPTRGTVLIAGKEPSALSPRERARSLAYVPQRSELTTGLSVEAVVSQGRFAHRRGGGGRMSPRDREVVDEAMSQTDTRALALRSFTELSQGERQRVLLARALATEARIIFLDEPTASLDIGHALELFELLGRLKARGYAIIVVLHHLADALDVTERAMLLREGRAVACGETASVLAPEPLRSVYGVSMEARMAPRFRLAASRDSAL